MRRRRTVLITSMALAAVLFAGCSGDSESTATTVSAERSTDTSDGGSSGSDGSEATNIEGPEDCKLIGEAFIDNGAAVALGDALSEGTDPTEAFQKGADSLDEVKDKVSPELQEPVATLAEAYQQLAETTSKIDWEKLNAGDQEEAKQMQEFAGAFSAKDTADAAKQLTTWVNENCAQ